MRSLLLILFFTLPVYAPLAAGCTATLTARVTSVHDGDTITVLSNNTEHKIRLNGIDAPELGQAFGQASKRNLSGLIFGKAVQIETNKTDRYGRLIGTVLLDGRDINLAQLRAGMAWYYKQYERDVAVERRSSYADAEREARVARRGLWADAAPVAPWDYRHPDPATVANGKIIGNRNSMIYHRPDCPDYAKVREKNRALFESEVEAVEKGYRRARNCP